MKLFRVILQLFLFVFPWPLRKFFLILLLDFKLNKSAKIGYSIVLAESVILHEDARILNGNFINRIDHLELAKQAEIGNFNWITGASTKTSAYSASPGRTCTFQLSMHASITDRHYFDCNGGIYVGAYTTVAGLRSQFISHGINIIENQQEAGPIKIGEYCMVGSGVKVLKGASLPDKSVLAAGAILNKTFVEPYGVFAGIPAKRVKELPAKAKYFHRTVGPVK
jgi:acetyltransferase-like isoleucine patch superfamily enzyme